MKPTRRLLCLAAAIAVVAAACSAGDPDTTGSTLAPGAVPTEGAITIPIAIDGQADDFSTSLFSFFPNAVEAHAGDTVEFTSRFGGEPHTVVFGTIVDEALSELAAVPPGSPRPASVAATLDRLPKFFDEEAPILPLSEPLPGGAQPCYVATGDPPAGACPVQQQPATFTGRESVYSSGFLPDEATFSVRLGDDITPGSYRFMCLVHGADESGVVTVVDPAQPVATPAQVAELGRTQFEGKVAQVRPAAEQIRASTSPQAMVGGRVEGAGSTEINVFPEEISIGAGDTVSWTVTTAHTISFNAPEDARPLYVTDAQGAVRANRKGADPAGGPGQPPPDLSAPAASSPVVVDGGSFDGQGFRSSGLLVDVGAPVEYRLTFTKPGTYKYRCNFHLDMEGTIKVG